MIRRRKVLVVDDEDRFTRMVKVNLEMTGRYEVHIETCGSRCLEAARDFSPDVIFLDIIMPDMTGYDVASALSRDPLLCKKPVIFLTALSESEVRHETGADRFFILTKPVTSQALAACIEDKINGGAPHE